MILDDPWPDDKYWVIAHDGERGVLYGNPHTYRGRFSVTWESTGDFHATSLDDLAEVSPDARAWLIGCLHGNEPTIGEVVPKAANIPDPALDVYLAWERERDSFRRVGYFHQTDDPKLK